MDHCCGHYAREFYFLRKSGKGAKLAGTADTPPLEDYEGGYSALRQGWFLGGSEYKNELKEGVCEHLSHLDRGSFVGEPRRIHDESEVERLARGENLENPTHIKFIDLYTGTFFLTQYPADLLGNWTFLVGYWILKLSLTGCGH